LSDREGPFLESGSISRPWIQGSPGLDLRPNQTHIACHVSCRLILLVIEFFHSRFHAKKCKVFRHIRIAQVAILPATHVTHQEVSDLSNVSFPDSVGQSQRAFPIDSPLSDKVSSSAVGHVSLATQRKVARAPQAHETLLILTPRTLAQRAE
jgi:hypothetical protein